MPSSENQDQCFQTTLSERENLLRNALHDARQAVECMEQGDWLRADLLLKLATDQLADTGLIP